MEDKKGWKMISDSNLKLKNIIEDLNESPQRIDFVNFDHLENDSENRNHKEHIVKNFNFIGKYKNGLKIYTKNHKGLNWDYFCDDVRVVAFFQYLEDEKTMIENRVWQDGLSLGLCRDLIFNYYFKKFNKIISDDSHTKRGEEYWKKLTDTGLKQNYKVKIQCDDGQVENVKSPDNLDFYYDRNPQFKQLRIILEK